MLIERLAQMYVHWGSPGKTGEPTERKRDQAVAAVHQFLDVIESTAEDRKALFTQSQQSRRKATKLAYLLLAGETEPTAIHDTFLRSGLLSEGQRSNKPEVLLWFAGTEAIARGIHPYIAFLIMSSYFGLETAETEFRWLQERAGASGVKLEEYIVPGDLTDSIEEALKEPARLQRTIRIAGMPLSASAFAGCSVYYIEKILALVGPIGALILTQMIQSARTNLVSDEIGTAQQAFLDLFTQEETESTTSEREAGAAEEAFFEEPKLPDPELIHTTTSLVMEADAKILKATLSSMSNGEITLLLRCLDAIAHERLLNLISPGRQKRVLAVIQKTENATSEQMLRDAQLFAQKLLAAYAPKNLKPGETLGIPEKLRGLISYLLSRE
ncbi:MAG TPA: hypothetical protein DDZ37_00015 [Spirochaetaceae bacterium]|nr:hypothetical protein [Spirochaetaceae bacterium]